MSKREMQLFAKEMLECHLGFTVNSYKDIVLLESAENGKAIEYLLFRRAGFVWLSYSLRKVNHGYELTIEYADKYEENNSEMTIPSVHLI